MANFHTKSGTAFRFLLVSLIVGWLVGLGSACSVGEEKSDSSKAKNPGDVASGKEGDPPAAGTQTPTAAQNGNEETSDGSRSGEVPVLADPTDPHSGLGTGDLGSVTTLQSKLDSVTPATEQEVVQFFQSDCQACHMSGGGFASFWSTNFLELNKSMIRSDPDAHKVFQTIVNAIEGFATPSPMPKDNLPQAGSERFNTFLKTIEWYINEAPEVAVNAYMEYQHVNPFGNDVDITFNYTCPKPVKFRTYLSRVTFDAFGRYPTDADFAFFAENGGFGKEDIVTEEMRRSVARAIFSQTSWRQEFLDVGLHNFARKLSGASELSAATSETAEPAGGDDLLKPALTASEAEDLKDEFYQLLLRNIDASGREVLPYADLLLGNTVPATLNTKELYGCSIKLLGGEKWDECDISVQNPLRQSYFTSFSFLASKPSSFLLDNNNYGRVATLYFFIRGQSLQAATNGPRGETVNPLPSCLKSKDTRGHKVGDVFGPFGSVQIPHTGNVCQFCHIGSNLANGSIVFRAFGKWGQSFFKEDFTGRSDVASIPGVSEALKSQRRSTENPRDESLTFDVDTAFLASLLPDSSGKFTDEQACVTSDSSAVLVNSVKDLARTLIGDGRELARGLARHIPRGISNINGTNSELIQEMEAAFREGGGRLMPMFEAYFASETFACGNEGAQ